MNELQTTNLFLGILAGVSLLQFLLLVAGLVIAYRRYTEVSGRLHELERNSVAPLLQTATDILSDVKAMTTRLNARAGRFEQTVKDTGDRVHDTTERVKTRMRARVMPFVAFVREFREAMREDAPRGADDHPR